METVTGTGPPPSRASNSSRNRVTAAIGLLAALVSSNGQRLLGADARAFVIVGVLGGFTTFSSFSLETLELARGGALGAAGANVAFSVELCLFGAWLGFATAGLLNH